MNSQKNKMNFGEIRYSVAIASHVRVTSKSMNLAKRIHWFPWKPGHMTIHIKL